MGAIMVDGQWRQPSGTSENGNVMFKSKEQIDKENAWRETANYPVKTFKAEDFKANEFFDGNGNLINNNYNLIKNPDGSISLYAKPVEYNKTIINRTNGKEIGRASCRERVCQYV